MCEVKECTPTAPHCMFFIKGKHRHCNLPPTAGSDYCKTHQTTDKIPCPRDPHHFVLKSELEKHLKKCSGTGISRSEQLPCYSHGINGVPRKKEEKFNLWSNQEIVLSVAKWLLSLKLEPKPRKSVLRSERAESVDRELFRSSQGSVKNLPQISSLIENMKQKGILSNGNGTLFAEFGAGKAHLAKLVSACIGNNSTTAALKIRMLLIDKEKFAKKAEGQSLGGNSNTEFIRLQIDIADLNLAETEEIKSKETKSVCVFGKHLCGSACDLALKCIVNLKKTRPDLSPYSIAIALCCFHHCDVNTYCNLPFIENLGLKIEYFPFLCSMSSWVASDALTAFPQQVSQSQVAIISEESLPKSGEYVEFSQTERRELGRIAREVLAFGRIDYLHSNGFRDAELLCYCNELTSPENLLLLAQSS